MANPPDPTPRKAYHQWMAAGSAFAKAVIRGSERVKVAMCEHKKFEGNILVNRLENTREFVAEITITCAECGVPMQFLGLESGLDTQGAMVSVDGLKAIIGIAPKGTKPNPFRKMAFSIKKSNL